MAKKRPIDKLRESAGAMDIGTPEDGAVKEFMPVGNTLYIVKERAIYLFRFADEIDPGRTNVDIPNIQQKIASVGTESETVCRILLTGAQLFQKKFLADHIDTELALNHCIAMLQDVLAMQAAAASLKEAQEAAELTMNQAVGSFALGAITDTRARASTFLQKAEHAMQSLYALCVHIYGVKGKVLKRLFDGIAENAQTLYGSEDDFTIFALESAPFLRSIRIARNCVEHPKPQERVVLTDYAMLASGKIAPPMIEIVHPKQPLEQLSLLNFMEQMISQFIDVAETYMAWLCSKHVKNQVTLPVVAAQVPEDQRRFKCVEYGYVSRVNDQIVRVS